MNTLTLSSLPRETRDTLFLLAVVAWALYSLLIRLWAPRLAPAPRLRSWASLM